MAGCNRCGPRGCHDFSSRAEQLPSLVAIDVLEKILMQAVRNSARRCAQVEAGEMSPQERQGYDIKVRDWMTATLMGENEHYQTAENWNPVGLTDYLRQTLSKQFVQMHGGIPEDDREVINSAVELFMIGFYNAFAQLRKHGHPYEGIEQHEQLAGLIGFWSQVFSGSYAFQ